MATGSTIEGAWERVLETKTWFEDRMGIHPLVGVVLGSGLGYGAGLCELRNMVPYSEIPNFPRSTAPGHQGALGVGRIGSVEVAVLMGRFHYYEGYSAFEVSFPIRALATLGVRLIILTNAAGGLNPLFEPGDIMAIVDHINLIPDNPLRGIHDERLGERFPDMSRAYDPGVLRIAEQVALAKGIALRKGVYVGVPGPSLETPAETRLLRLAGADAVGMSTTLEVIAARSLGMRVAGFSVISNVNRPDCMAPILVDEILECSKRASTKLMDLIQGVILEVQGELGQKDEKG